MSETVAVGILSATTALLAILIERIFEERRGRSEEKRWYADYFIGRKIDALTLLYSELIDWQYAINLYGNSRPSTLEEYKGQLHAHEIAFRRAMVMAKVYLSEEVERIIRDTFSIFSQANQAIWFSLPDEEIPNIKKANYPEDVKRIQWERFFDTFTKASECLGNLLNPDILNEVPAAKRKGHDNRKRAG